MLRSLVGSEMCIRDRSNYPLLFETIIRFMTSFDPTDSWGMGALDIHESNFCEKISDAPLWKPSFRLKSERRGYINKMVEFTNKPCGFDYNYTMIIGNYDGDIIHDEKYNTKDDVYFNYADARSVSIIPENGEKSTVMISHGR